jgi:hypothetical protein
MKYIIWKSAVFTHWWVARLDNREGIRKFPTWREAMDYVIKALSL